MKRSRSVPLYLLPGLAAGIAAGCGPSVIPLDPCDSPTYDALACQTAVANRGYYYSGIWYPHVYSYPMLYYANQRTVYVSRGGATRAVPSGAYAPHTSVSSGGSRPGVTTGGFGGIGSGHFTAGS